MSTPSRGFAPSLLAEAREKIAAERLRHAEEMRRLEARAAVLEAMGARTRRQVLLDPDATPEMVRAAVTSGNKLTAVEFAALLQRPQTDALYQLAADVLKEAQESGYESGSERHETRLVKMVDAVLDVDCWPPSRRVALLLGRWNRTTERHLIARIAGSPDVALLVGMHLGPRTWGKTSPGLVDALRRHRRSNTWLRLGSLVEAGQMPAVDERPIRERLAALRDPFLAVRVAEQLPPRAQKGPTALTERVATIETLCAGIGSPSAPTALTTEPADPAAGGPIARFALAG